MARRRSVMLDEEHARLLYSLAERYGVPVAAYLRGLVEAAWFAEERGVNAAAAMYRGVVFELLVKLGALPVPRELLEAVDPSAARNAGRRLGASLAAVSRERLWELLAELAERLGVGVAEYSRLLIFPQQDGWRLRVAELLVGIAEGGMLGVKRDAGGFIVISVPSVGGRKQS